jgi:hypothetical protein
MKFLAEKKGRRASKARSEGFEHRYARGADWRVCTTRGERMRLLIVLSVLCCKGREILRQLCFSENRGGLANRNARPAVNAVYGIDVELGDLGVLGFILARMNAINRANLDALLIFGATFDDYECHESILL